LQGQPGEIVALVGESGCGKSTLARGILGLVPITRGEVLHYGEPVPLSGRGLRNFRRQAQLVLQDPTGALNPRQSVYESVAEGLPIHRIAGNEEELVAAALARCVMRPPARFCLRCPHGLPGGKRQRVVIAGARVFTPTWPVADEPVSSLD